MCIAMYRRVYRHVYAMCTDVCRDARRNGCTDVCIDVCIDAYVYASFDAEDKTAVGHPCWIGGAAANFIYPTGTLETVPYCSIHVLHRCSIHVPLVLIYSTVTDDRSPANR